jgi:uncharacterized Zn-binding protein involved in type VI secretion
MAKVIRVGDPFSGTCNTHGPVTGTVTSGGSAKANGQPIARVGDGGTCSCGHTFTITSGSSRVSSDGRGVCRVGDQATVNIVGGTLTAQSGSTTVDAL